LTPPLLDRLKPRGPNIRVPPLYFIGGFLLGLLLDGVVEPLRFVGGTASPRALTVAGWAVFWIGMIVAHSGVATFWLAGTTMFPFKPASALVQHGPYKFTRNPMYLGLTIAYVGLALALNTAWPLILLPLMLWLLVKTVIEREEQYLVATFGDEYLAYKKRVRRWL
jgi:protein-S-isoprenylcysteine O-methyltransferase Ste14